MQLQKRQQDFQSKSQIKKSIRYSQLPKEIFEEIFYGLKPNLKFPIRIQNFANFRDESSVYIDKSLLIIEIIKSGCHLLLTCPRRWGKSLNMSMIKTFFQPDADDLSRYKNGRYDFIGEYRSFNDLNQSYKGANKFLKYFIGDTFSNSKKKLLPLEISKHSDYLLYEGQHPVIYLDLKDVNGDNKIDFEESLRSQISCSFKEHKYLYMRILLDKLNFNFMINKGQKIKEIWIHKKWYDSKEQKIHIDKLLEDINGDQESLIENLEGILFDIELKFIIPQKLIRLNAYYNNKNIEEANLNESLIFLSELLYKFFNRKKRYIYL